MPTRRKRFATVGAASSFKRQITDYSGGLLDLPHVTDLGDVTPFQRQVLDAAEAEEAEQQRQRMNQQSGGSGGRQRNSRASTPNTGGNEREETVRYVNKQQNPDYDVHD